MAGLVRPRCLLCNSWGHTSENCVPAVTPVRRVVPRAERVIIPTPVLQAPIDEDFDEEEDISQEPYALGQFPNSVTVAESAGESDLDDSDDEIVPNENQAVISNIGMPWHPIHCPNHINVANLREKVPIFTGEAPGPVLPMMINPKPVDFVNLILST